MSGWKTTPRELQHTTTGLVVRVVDERDGEVQIMVGYAKTQTCWIPLTAIDNHDPRGYWSTKVDR